MIELQVVDDLIGKLMRWWETSGIDWNPDLMMWEWSWRPLGRDLEWVRERRRLQMILKLEKLQGGMRMKVGGSLREVDEALVIEFWKFEAEAGGFVMAANSLVLSV
ncbi:hypothetical protein U1Q18_012865 [Sarracenia purpurea var. burkii]